MAIQRESEIKYQDLLTYIYDNIKSLCYNVDTISSSIDSKLKYNTSWTVASSNGRTLVAKVTDDFLTSPVSLDVVKTQLTEYLSARGLLGKDNQIVSFKNIMHFYNNIAAFLSTKLVFVMGTYNTTDAFLCYDPNQTSFPAVNTQCPTTSLAYNDAVARASDLKYDKSQVMTTVNDIMTAINKTSRIHYAKTTLTFTSCSSSSSSSSSSCSSSSSSSSSLFIAYMNI